MEVMRFCQSFMTELFRHIGPSTDVPAGDIGVGGREIGFMFGQYKRLANRFEGVLTGKGLNWGGSLIRPEATGYGQVYFAVEMLKTRDMSLEGKTCLISGAGNVAQYAAEKVLDYGGKVLSFSDSSGFIVDEEGIDRKKLDYVMHLKNTVRGRISEYVDEYPKANFVAVDPSSDHNPLWDVKADVALPAATQNEINATDAANLVRNGIVCISEGANMPCTPEAVELFLEKDLLFGPAKAANAGGVATSALEMSQNSMRLSWSRKEVDAKLHSIMKSIHATCQEHAKRYGSPWQPGSRRKYCRFPQGGQCHDGPRFGMNPGGGRSSKQGSLMPNLVKDILMVASPYDCFILEEDGRFADQMLAEYAGLELSSPPRFYHVTTSSEAMAALRERQFDLVLTTPHCADATPQQLASKLGRLYPNLPVVMLTYDRTEAQKNAHDPSLNRVFLWTGDPKLLLALVKLIEDQQNVDSDTRHGQVPVIIVVEDDPPFYSSFLPQMYAALMDQTKLLLPERLNERDRRSRTRARPKILLARNYEEATHLFDRYGNYLLGILCDMSFPRRGKMVERAGMSFIGKVLAKMPEMPVMMQSWNAEHGALATKAGLGFVHKRSEQLYDQVKDFMMHHFGFGDFVFRDRQGRKLDKAANIGDMIQILRGVPVDSLMYHAERQQFSNWLRARGEFDLVQQLKPRKVGEFKDGEAVRAFLIQVLQNHLQGRQLGQVTEFPENGHLDSRDFIRFGSGSMGGKSRGIAFVSHLLSRCHLHQKYPNVKIFVPWTTVICTDIYDRYCAANDLGKRALDAQTDEEVAALFLSEPLDDSLMAVLEKIVTQIDGPLAVRSSSLLEDSTYQPLAGLYETFMLPNSQASPATRLQQLSEAVRLVIASSFFRKARRYLVANSFRPEREKMAVLIQRLVGRRFDRYFYPDFAGVAQSHNFYPLGYSKCEDGIATVALGLGRTVVEGRKALRFSPKHPSILPQMSSPNEALGVSQRDFFAPRHDRIHQTGSTHPRRQLMPSDLGRC